MSEAAPEIILPFQHPKERAPVATRVRSTLLCASFRMLRELGWEERYLLKLHPDYRTLIPGLVAGSWLPMETALAHYHACDQLGLSASEIATMGDEVSVRTRKVFVTTLGRLAVDAGLTPWMFLTNAHHIWARIFDAGNLCVHKLGPKEAVLIIAGCPLFEIPYFRVALRTYLRSFMSLAARAAFAREEVRYAGAMQIGIRFSWA